MNQFAKTQRKCYLKRKRCLARSRDEIHNTLERICILHNVNYSEPMLHGMAIGYAKNVEASCIKVHHTMSNDAYERVMARKTQDLCEALVKRMVPWHQQHNFLSTDLSDISVSNTRKESEVSSSPTATGNSGNIETGSTQESKVDIDEFDFDDSTVLLIDEYEGRDISKSESYLLSPSVVAL